MATKFTGWQNIRTIQSTEILTELLEAKNEYRVLTIICDTGLGKTYNVDLFAERNKKQVYKVTVGDTHNLMYVLQELMEQLGMRAWQGKNSRYRCLRDITTKLIELNEMGVHPVVILDEMENAKNPLLKALKQLYDAVVNKCSLVLIGTHQLIDILEKKSRWQSIPQLKRRLKAGTRYITPLNKAKHFKPFFDAHSVPGDVQDMLFDIADNYGELHDYLEPVLRRCAAKNIELTKEEFCRYHKLPMTKQFINTKTNAA